jgi:hypothetical protein
MSIDELKNTLKLAKKNKHKHMAKAIKIQTEEIEQEGKEPKKTIKQRITSMFSKRKGNE